MYVYVYVCICVCVYMCMYVLMYVYVCTHVYVCIRVCMYLCMYVYMYMCKGGRMQMLGHVYVYVYMYMCMYECMHACMHAHTYTVRIQRVARPGARELIYIFRKTHERATLGSSALDEGVGRLAPRAYLGKSHAESQSVRAHAPGHRAPGRRRSATRDQTGEARLPGGRCDC